MTGQIFNIQHFSIHDGPGIRTTVFFKGCNLHCWWCHNPESLRPSPQLRYEKARCIACGECVKVCPASNGSRPALHSPACLLCGACADACVAGAIEQVGKRYEKETLMAEILRDRAVYERSGGGVTFSGGEPLLQAEFLSSVLASCRSEGIHTAIETACCVKWDVIEGLLPNLNLVISDIKTMDDDAHRKATGQSNHQILDNLRRISASGTPLLLRTPVIPGFNAQEEQIEAIAAFIASLPGEHVLELLPFRSLCTNKYDALSLPFAGKDVPTPSQDEMERMAGAARRQGIHCRINGM